MKKSQYHLVSYDEKQCAVTIISKGKMLSSGAAVGGHMYLALEAKNITGTGEDWMVFDFISNGGAEAQLTRNQGAFEEMKKLLRKVADDLSNPESLRKAALGLITLEFNITSSNKILTFLLTAAPESVFEIVRHIVKISAEHLLPSWEIFLAAKASSARVIPPITTSYIKFRWLNIVMILRKKTDILVGRFPKQMHSSC